MKALRRETVEAELVGTLKAAMSTAVSLPTESLLIER
jgi:hypothetical protein